jgi:hypothetical protein
MKAGRVRLRESKGKRCFGGCGEGMGGGEHARSQRVYEALGCRNGTNIVQKEMEYEMGHT